MGVDLLVVVPNLVVEFVESIGTCFVRLVGQVWFMGCLYVLFYFGVGLCTADSDAIGIVDGKFREGAVVNLCALCEGQILVRNVAEDDVVGCPCFLCDYEGYIPGFNKVKKAIVYVKAFGTKTLWMTKMFFVEENQPSFYIDEIKDGDSFTMDDGRRYVYRDGVISLLS